MSDKRKHRTPLEYLRYLKGELSREERHAFEREMEADPFEKEAMEGMETQTADAIEEDLLAIHASLHKRLQKRRRRNFYYAAASVASLLIVGTIFLTIYNINPKTNSESIPRDESFLHEQDAIPREEPKAPETDIRPTERTDRAAPEEELSGDAEISEGQGTPEVIQEMPPGQAESQKKEAGAEKGVEEPDIVAVEAQPTPREKTGMNEAVITEQQAETPEQQAETPKLQAEIPEQQGETPELHAEAFEQDAAAPMQKAANPMRRDAMPIQINRVSGVVVSAENMEPLPEATILVEGRDSGVMADMQGRFSLEANPREQTRVIASFVGMKPEEYRLDDQKENRLILEPDTGIQDEVVVMDYVDLNNQELNYQGAEPEGGLEAYKMYIEEQIRFPAGEPTDQRKAVVLKFNVLRDGTLSGIQSLRSPGEAFTEEAIRLLKEGPGWNPARNENGPLDEVVRMRIVFER